MADLNGGFNADDFKSDDLLPEGEYHVVILESDLSRRKAGNGTDWKITFQVMNGKSQNRQFSFWFAYDIPGATGGMLQALEIGKRTIADICRAVNVLKPQNTTDLAGKRLILKLKLKDGKDGVTRNQIAKCTALLTSAKPAAPNMVEQAFETTEAVASTTEKKNPFA